MDRSASRIRDAARLGLVGAIAMLLALSRASVATATSDLVLICHATGSDSNEIVIIRVDQSGLNGHDLEELAKTYDCQPAGGSGDGGVIDSTEGGASGSGGTSGGTSGGDPTGVSSAPSPGASPTAGPGSVASPGASPGGSSGGSSSGSSGGAGGAGGPGSGGAGSGASSPRDGSDDPSGPRVMIIGAAGIGPEAAQASLSPDSLTLAAGAVRAALPMTDTLARFLAHSSGGQRLGVGLTAIAGLGFLLLVIFGSLARRRA